MSDRASSAEVTVSSSESLWIGPLRLSWLGELVFVSLLALVFCTLHRSTLMRPYHEEDLRAAHAAHLLLQNHLKPAASDFRSGSLVLELYAAGWLVLGREYEWWPHAVALVFAFLALRCIYRIGGGGGGASFAGFLCAALLAVDPLFLAESSGISAGAPSIGLATAALYYFLFDKPKRFAIAGSLTALCNLPAALFLLCLIGLALIRHLVQIEWDIESEFYFRGLFNRGRDRGAVVCFLIPGIVFAAWALLCRWLPGHSIVDPMWGGGVPTAGFPPRNFGVSLRDIVLWHGHLPFTIVTAFGVAAFWGGLLRVHLAGYWSRDQARWWVVCFAGADEVLLLSAMLAGIAVFAAVMAVSGAVAEGPPLLVLLVPLFILTFEYIRCFFWAARQQLRLDYKFREPARSMLEYAWVIAFSMLLGWNLRALRYSAAVTILSVVLAVLWESSFRWAMRHARAEPGGGKSGNS